MAATTLTVNIFFRSNGERRAKETWPIAGSDWSVDEKLALEVIEIRAPDATHPLAYLAWNDGLSVDLLRRASDYDLSAMAYAVQIDTILSWFDTQWLVRPESLAERSVIQGYRAFVDPKAKEMPGKGRCQHCRLDNGQAGQALPCRLVPGDRNGCAVCQTKKKLDCSFKELGRIDYDTAKFQCRAAARQLCNSVGTFREPDPYSTEHDDLNLLLKQTRQLSHLVSSLHDSARQVVRLQAVDGAWTESTEVDDEIYSD